MRRLLFPALLLLLAFGPPKPRLESLAADVSQATDTTLRVISTWGYKTQPAVFPDSTRVKVGLGATPPATDKGHFVRWPQATDTTFVPVSTYGSITGYVCVVPHRGETWGSQTCVAWAFLRPEPPVPPFDTMTVKLTLAPPGVQIAPDATGACAAWQAANPSRSVWIAVNVQAVMACTGADGKPIVAQFCAFAELRDGSRVKTTPTAGLTDPAAWDYCDLAYRAWLSAANG